MFDCVWTKSGFLLPIAVFHVSNRLRRPVDGAGDARVPPGPSRVVLEVGSRLVLVALEAVVERAVRFVEVLVLGPGFQTFLRKQHRGSIMC